MGPIVEFQIAFNRFRNRFNYNDNELVDLINKEAGLKHLKGISSPYFRKCFPKKPESSSEYLELKTESRLRKVFQILELLMAGLGQNIEWAEWQWQKNARSEVITLRAPRLDDNGDFVLLQSAAFAVFYWSKRQKSINEGVLNLVGDYEAVLKLDYRENDNTISTVQITGNFEKSGSTYYVYGLKRTNKENGFTLSEIKFRINDFEDISIGVYASSSFASNHPYNGIMVFVKKKAAITQQTRSMIKYLLFYQRYDLPETGFRVDLKEQRNNQPQATKIWSNIYDNYRGNYIGYFPNPYLKRFEQCLVCIFDDGQVRIYVSSLLQQENKYYKGIARAGTSRPTAHKLMLLADYFPDFLEYRVRIYLDAYELLSNKSEFITGLYTCFRLEDVKPMSVKFLMSRYTGSIDEGKLKDIVNPIPLDDATRVGELQKVLSNHKIDDFFFPENPEMHFSV